MNLVCVPFGLTLQGLRRESVSSTTPHPSTRESEGSEPILLILVRVSEQGLTRGSPGVESVQGSWIQLRTEVNPRLIHKLLILVGTSTSV